MKSFSVKAKIAAQPETIWRILTNAPEYSSWNSSVTGVDGNIELGSKVTVHAKISPGRSYPVKVVTLEAPRQMVWSSEMPLGLFKGQRTFELRPSNDGTVVFSMSEQFTGLMAPLITKSIPDLQPAFEEFAACLKSRAEQRS